MLRKDRYWIQLEEQGNLQMKKMARQLKEGKRMNPTQMETKLTEPIALRERKLKAMKVLASCKLEQMFGSFEFITTAADIACPAHVRLQFRQQSTCSPSENRRLPNNDSLRINGCQDHRLLVDSALLALACRVAEGRSIFYSYRRKSITEKVSYSMKVLNFYIIYT